MDQKKIIGKILNFLAIFWPNLAGKWGLDLFLNPFARKVSEKHNAFLDTAQKAQIPFLNYSIMTYKWGSGDKHVLLVHGWSSHSGRWKKYVEALVKDGFTVYALDAPAHGNSSGKRLYLPLYKETLVHFLQTTPQIKYLVSHSIGGASSVLLLFENREIHLDKMVIMAAPGEVNDFFTMYEKTLGLKPKALHYIKKQFLALVKNPPEYYSSKRMAMELNTPVLIIHDKNDKVTDPKKSIALHENWKGSKLILTENLGHELQDDAVIKTVIEELSVV
jgi:pimeloyl-ACP methyl ester carboxylesterase